MSVSATLASGDTAPVADFSAIPAFVFPSELGAGNVYQFDPGDNLNGTIGSSDGAEGTYWFLRNSGVSCVVSVCAGTPGTKSAIVHTGTGPAITAGYASGLTAPLLTTSIGAKVLAGGANGAALLGYYLDGSGDYTQYTATVPAEGPAVLLGTVALTDTIAVSLDTLTLVFSAPAAFTVTFAAPLVVQDIADQINAQATSGTKVNRAEIYQTSAGSFLRLYTTTLGTSVTQTIDAATSTGEAILGFSSGPPSNLTITGTAATLPIAFTGLTLTFASGTYVAADTYTMTTTGPTASTSAIATALDNLRDSGFDFGRVEVLTPPTTAANARSLCDTTDAKVATWDTDPDAIFPIQLTPGPFHTASATPATNATNIATVDQALLAAFAGQTSIGTVVPGDGYAIGTKVAGSYRRPALLAVSYMLSAFKLSDDPGAATHGAIPEWSLTAPDGVTLARDQSNPRAVNKLGGSTGPGFTVLRNVKSPRVMHGVTRAGVASRLVDLGPGLRMGRRGQQVLFDTAKRAIENETFPTDSTGKLREDIRRALEGVFTADLTDALTTAPNNVNASSVGVVIDPNEILANTKNITATATLQKLGVAENVTIKAIVAGTVVSAALTG